MRQILRPDRVWDTVSGVRVGVEVVVDDERITDIVKLATADTAGAEVHELPGATLIPGLINMHVHMFSTTMAEDWSTVRRTIHAVRNCAGALVSGLTTVVDLGAAHTIFELSAAQRRGDLAGPRILAAGKLIAAGRRLIGRDDNIRPESYRDAVDGPDNMRAAVRRQLRAGADVIKILVTTAIGGPRNQPFGVLVMSPEEMSAAVDEAHLAGRRVHSHAYGAKGIAAALEAGVDVIQHGTGIDERGIEIMLRNGGALVPTMSIYPLIINAEPGAVPPYSREKATKARELHYSSVANAAKAGVTLGFGTDTGSNYAILGDMSTEFAAWYEVGLSADDILLAATMTNARLLGWDDRIGSIEPGKFADLVALDGDPRTDPGAWTRVRSTWTAGRRHPIGPVAVLLDHPVTRVSEP